MRVKEGESRLFCVLVLFLGSKFFRKKINKLEIVLIASTTILVTTRRESKGKPKRLHDSQREKPNDYINVKERKTQQKSVTQH